MSERAKRKMRAKIRSQEDVWSVCVDRSANHFRAQLRDPEGKIVTGLSTLNAEVKKAIKYGGNAKAAFELGKLMGQKIAKDFGVKEIVFDRSGYLYIGRVAAFVNGLRDASIQV